MTKTKLNSDHRLRELISFIKPLFKGADKITLIGLVITTLGGVAIASFKIADTYLTYKYQAKLEIFKENLNNQVQFRNITKNLLELAVNLKFANEDILNTCKEKNFDKIQVLEENRTNARKMLAKANTENYEFITLKSNKIYKSISDFTRWDDSLNDLCSQNKEAVESAMINFMSNIKSAVDQEIKERENQIDNHSF